MSFLNTKTAGLTPYKPGDQPRDKKYIKINTNENPYPPSPKAITAALGAIGESLKLYPDPEARLLKSAIAKVEGLDEECVFAGNGSDEVLAMCFSAFFEPQSKPILFADITYSFYPVYASEYRVNYETLPLNENFKVDISAYNRDNGGIIICNPNAPTGILLSLDEIAELAGYTKGVLIVDEAYIAFGGESATKLLAEHNNILIIRTLSKSHSLAGMRVGYALGSKELISGLNCVKNSFNSYTLDRIAIECAAASIEDKEYFIDNAEKIISTRERITAELEQMNFRVLPSKANFIFISHPSVAAENIYLSLKEEGVLVRYFNTSRIDNWLRVTIGTDDEMDVFVQKLKKVVN